MQKSELWRDWILFKFYAILHLRKCGLLHTRALQMDRLSVAALFDRNNTLFSAIFDICLAAAVALLAAVVLSRSIYYDLWLVFFAFVVAGTHVGCFFVMLYFFFVRQVPVVLWPRCYTLKLVIGKRIFLRIRSDSEWVLLHQVWKRRTPSACFLAFLRGEVLKK